MPSSGSPTHMIRRNASLCLSKIVSRRLASGQIFHRLAVFWLSIEANQTASGSLFFLKWQILACLRGVLGASLTRVRQRRILQVLSFNDNKIPGYQTAIAGDYFYFVLNVLAWNSTSSHLPLIVLNMPSIVALSPGARPSFGRYRTALSCIWLL